MGLHYVLDVVREDQARVGKHDDVVTDGGDVAQRVREEYRDRFAVGDLAHEQTAQVLARHGFKR